MEIKSTRFLNDSNIWLGSQIFHNTEFLRRATFSGGAPWYDVRGFGAKSDGVTNDTAAIQAAIDAAETAGGGRVYFSKGVYYVAGALTGRSRVLLLGDGPELSRIIFADSGTHGIGWFGSTTGTVALAANVNIGNLNVTLAVGGGANFVVGDLIFLQRGTTSLGSHLTFVKSVAGDVVTMIGASPFPFPTSDSSTAAYLNPMMGVGAVGLSFELASLAATRTILLDIRRSKSVKLQNCRFVNGGISSGFYGSTLTNVTIDDCEFFDCRPQSAIQLQDCSNATISGNKVKGSGFGVALFYSSNIVAIGNSIVGQNRDGIVSVRGLKFAGCANCTAYSNTISTWGATACKIEDSHEITVGGNVFFAIGSTTADHAISTASFDSDRTYGNTIANNTVNDVSGIGVYVTVNDETLQSYHSVTGNNVNNTGSDGIRIDSSYCLANGNVIRGVGGSGVGIRTTANTTKNSIIGNILYMTGGREAIRTVDSNGSNGVKANDAHGSGGNNLHVSDYTTGNS